MKMMDYVVMAHDRMKSNLREGAAAGLADAYRVHAGRPVRIIASGSSRNAAMCARDYMQHTLQVPVLVATPEAFMRGEYEQPSDAFHVGISQSGYSTNTLAALDFMSEHGIEGVALTGNVQAPIKDHAKVVVDYGVGVESVDFVTMGVLTLVEFLDMFALAAAFDMGRIDEAGLRRGMADIAQAIEAHGSALKAAREFVDAHHADLSRLMPVMVVGNGANYGVALEAALKLNETVKIPAMAHECEEFFHGPEMQIVPGYHVFIMDDPEGSERIGSMASMVGLVSASTYFITSHPTGSGQEIVLPELNDPRLSSIPNLAIFQTIAATMTEDLKRWRVHPYYDAVWDKMAVKVEGYKESVEALEQKAARQYGDEPAR